MKKNLVAWVLILVMVVSGAHAAMAECLHENTVFYCTSAYRYRVEGDKCFAEYDTIEVCRDCDVELGEGVRTEERRHFLENGVCKSCGGTEAGVTEVVEKTEAPNEVSLPDLGTAVKTSTPKNGMLRAAIAIAIIVLVILLVALGLLLNNSSEKKHRSTSRKSSKSSKRKSKSEGTVATASKKRKAGTRKTTSKKSSKRKSKSGSWQKLFKESFEEGRAKAKRKKDTPKREEKEPSSTTPKHAPKHAAKAKEKLPEGSFD